MICLTSFLYWEATGEILQCENRPMFDECMDEAEEDND